MAVRTARELLDAHLDDRVSLRGCWPRRRRCRLPCCCGPSSTRRRHDAACLPAPGEGPARDAADPLAPQHRRCEPHGRLCRPGALRAGSGDSWASRPDSTRPRSLPAGCNSVQDGGHRAVENLLATTADLHERTQRLRSAAPTRCVIIIDTDLPAGRAASAAAAIALTIGARHPQLVGSPLVDASGLRAPGLIPIGIPVLAAPQSELNALRLQGLDTLLRRGRLSRPGAADHQLRRVQGGGEGGDARRSSATSASR